MAKRKKSRAMRKISPAITDLEYLIPAAGGTNTASDFYIDTNRSLSRVNRRLYDQGRMLAYQGMTFIWRAQPEFGDPARVLSTLQCTVKTAGNTWMVHNAFVKGKALWDEMQDLVLEDNPSIAGKWHDFKVKLSKNQKPNQELDVLDSEGAAYTGGEWNYSDYVMPQHEVDPVTGEPLAAEQFQVCLIGSDGTGSVGPKSLVKAYAESRATVQDIAPNVPGTMSTSFFNLLTDSGSQEPELADVIIGENDTPPYDLDNYPGGDTNAPQAVTVATAATSSAEVDGRVGPFVAPCGLLRVDIAGYDQDGVLIDPVDMPEVKLLLHVAPGMYKGIASIPMGQ